MSRTRLWIVALVILGLVLAWKLFQDAPPRREVREPGIVADSGKAARPAPTPEGRVSSVDSGGPQAGAASSPLASIEPKAVDVLAPDLEDDSFVTGIVVNARGEPVAGALVRFLPVDLRLQEMGGAIMGMATAMGSEGYSQNEARDRAVIVQGRSKGVITGADGRFRVRWPRKPPLSEDREKQAPMESSIGSGSVALRMKIETNALEDQARESGITLEQWSSHPRMKAPLTLRSAHGNYLPAQREVKPGDEVTITLAQSGGVRCLVKNPAGAPLPGVAVRPETRGFDMKRLMEMGHTDDEGQCLMLMPAGATTLVFSDEVHASERVDVEIPEEGLVDLSVTMQEGHFVSGTLFSKDGGPVEGAQLLIMKDPKSSGPVGNFGDSLSMKQGTSSYDGSFKLGPFGKDLPSKDLLVITHSRHQGYEKPLGENFDLGKIELDPLSYSKVRVVDEAGSPISGATVSAEWIFDENAFDGEEDTGDAMKMGQSFAGRFTGIEGEGEITGADGLAKVWGQGRHKIRVSHPEYAPPETQPVADVGKEPQPVTVVLLRGFTVDFRVVDGRGAPQAGATLHLRREEASGSVMEGMISGMMEGFMPDMSQGHTTDAKGHAVVKRLAPGKYTLSVRTSGGLRQRWQKPLSQDDQMDLVMEDPGTFYGRVDPLYAGMGVLAGNKAGNTRATIREDGTWETEPLAPGGYRVLLQEDSTDAMQMGMTMMKLSMPSSDQKILGAGERKFVDLTAEPVGSIRIRVTQADGSPYHETLMALSAGIRTGDMDIFDRMLTAEPSGGPGVFEFKRVPVGEWNLQPGGPRGGQKFKVKVEAGAKLDLTWKIRPADSVLRGRVLTPGGAPATGMLQLNLVDDDVPVATESLDGEGRFEFEELVPGDYEIHTADMSGSSRRLATVTVGPGERDMGDLTLQAGMTLRGTVRPVGGDLPMGLMVRIVREGRVVGTGLVNFDGTFEVGGLDAGPAEIQVGPMIGEPLTRTPWNGTATEVNLEVPGERW